MSENIIRIITEIENSKYVQPLSEKEESFNEGLQKAIEIIKNNK